ncbi:MAG: hydrogenase [Candidatus Polarisedimenticolia bacterium]
MSGAVDFLLLSVLVLDVYILSSSRLFAAVRASALQGAALAALPLLLASGRGTEALVHASAMSLGTLAIKAIVIPLLLGRAIRIAGIRREAEPFVSLHLSVLIGAGLIGFAFVLSRHLVLPLPVPTAMLVPVALATLLLGCLILVVRRKAITQVVGYLMVENGVFVFGQALSRQIPIVVELGILLDLLVGVFVMGITIHHISREFDHIDTDSLVALRDWP